ncbi:hypothetical protein [Cerasicoccus fimbriatus]|uniref:hypothetical protein n=1 Tax=Cerasicoccus fimbriatus TaxID=3014554 RepID=UPI0022B58FEC|nr:hypothetical protein [Cerasicoccus sp. TK19100]
MKSKSTPIIAGSKAQQTGCRLKRQSGGFALVISLLLMGFIVLMLLSLVTVSRVEMFSAATQQTRTQAEQNALLGLTVAIGNLQENLGVDQRVSASALMLDKNLADDSHMVNWIGAWDTAEKMPDGSQNPKYGQHIAWLVSGFDDVSDAGAIPAYVNPLNQDGELVDPDVDALLLGEGTVGNLTVTDYVAAPKVSVAGGGSYAYWVADEGLKARINLASREDMDLANYPGTTDILQGSLALSAPSGGAASVFNGLETMDVSNDSALAKNVARAETHSELFLADPLYTGSGTPRWQAGLQEHYHSTSLNSLSLQTDTKSGGLKKDLSLLFELDDSDFSRTPYTGVADMDAVFADNWTVFPPYDSEDVYLDPVSMDEVSYLFKEPVPAYGSNAFVRGPTWSYLRDFYRLYKGAESTSSMTQMKIRPFGPNTSDFPDDGGMSGIISTWETDGVGNIRTKDNYINTTVYNNASNRTEFVTRLTEHELLPVLNRVIFIYSLYNDSNVDEYEYVPEEERAEGESMFQATGNTTSAIAITIEPFVYLWNPYNVALEFDGGLKVHARDSPFGLMISVADPSADIIPPISDVSVPQMSGFLDGYGRITGRRFGTLDLLIGDEAEPIRMEPGEVLLFSAANSSPAIIDNLPRSNEEHGTRSAPYLKMEQGFRNTGGILLGRRLRTGEHVDQDGLFHQLPVVSDAPLEINVYNWGLNNFYREDSGKNTEDRRYSTSRAFNLEYAYVPEDELDDGGSLYTSDTFIQRLFLNIYGPLTGSTRGPLVDLLYDGPDASFPKSVDRSLLLAGARQPFLYLGLYQNPVVPDPDRVPTTSEFIGTMSPFAPLLDKQFSNHSIDSPPYTVQMGGTDSYSEIQQDSGRGYFGDKYSAGGQTNIVVSEVPTYPMQSLASFQHARVSPSTYMPGQAIGNSWASGFVDLDKTLEASGRYTLYDISYLSNDALFDGYFFSSLIPGADFTAGEVNQVDLETTLQQMADAYVTQGEAPEVMNERIAFIGSPDSLVTTRFVDDLNAIDGFSKSASYFAVKGGFNVNSLSVDAWDSFLASTLGADYTFMRPTGGFTEENSGDLTIFPRSTLPNGSASGGDSEWVSPRALSPDERRSLATSIVEEVRARGPFLSLGDFVNRRLVDDEVGKKGTIQAAIDRLDINESAEFVDAYTEGVASGTFDISHVTSKSGVGTPQYLTQADVLTPLAAAMTVRSDTFLIRSYGEANDPLTGEVQSRAWCEALVQRVPEFVNPDRDAPETQISNLQDEANKTMGRRFRVISFRWLGEDDV